jgi:putative transcriptional regulator
MAKLMTLKNKRKEAGITIYDMSRSLGITASFYSQIENGKRRLFYDTAIKISEIFNLYPDDLFYDEKK